MKPIWIPISLLLLIVFFQPSVSFAVEIELSTEKSIDLKYCDWLILDKYVEDIKGLEDPNITQQFMKIKLPLEKPLESKEGMIWLKCDVNVSEVQESQRKYLGSQLIIGDIEGNNVAYFNQYPIGVTNGRGITSQGVPRAYLIPPRDIKFGMKNTISIRISAVGNGKLVGIMREPLTLCNLGNYFMFERYKTTSGRINILDKLLFKALSYGYADEKSLIKMLQLKSDCDNYQKKAYDSINKGNYKKADDILQIVNESLSSNNTDLAKFEGTVFNLFKAYKSQLNRAVFDEIKNTYGAEEVDKFFPKILSFGRFGKFLNDGLTTFREVSPTEIVTRKGDRFRIYFDDVFDSNLIDINWVSKTTHTIGKSLGNNLHYYMISTTLFPGVLMNVPDNREIGFQIFSGDGKFPTKIVTSDGMLDIDENPAYLGDIKESWLLFYLSQEKDCPIQLVFEKIPDYVYVKKDKDGENVLIFKNKSDVISKVVVLLPYGIEYINTKNWNETLSREVLLKASHIAKFARFFPIYCEEYFRINWEKDMVEVYDIFDYSVLPPKTVKDKNEFSQMYKLAYIPPQLSFIADNGYPVQLPEQLVDIGIPAFLGPVRGVRTNSNVLIYRLPIPPLNERGIVNVGGDKELMPMVNDYLTDLGKKDMWNAVDRIYKNRAHSYIAWAYLSEENRKKLQENSKEVVASGFSDNVWFERIEPFSKVKYWFTYFLEGPYYDTYDIDWGNGLSLYGYYKYAQYSGDWELINDNWGAIDKMMRWFEVADDWDWMRSSNAVYGYGTGAGDCTTVEYAGVVAYTKMARALKRDVDFQKGLYKCSKVAVPTISRFLYKDWALKYDLIKPDEYIIGFFEGEGFNSIKVDNYLWEYTSNISGNGIQPECFDLYMKYIADKLKEYETVIDKFNWFDGNHKYPNRTLYKDNSGYITLPHIYARARLGYPLEELRKYLISAKSNSYLWWQAPAVIAEILSRDADFYLLDWVPAQYKEGFYDGKKATLTFNLMGEGNIFLKIHANKKPNLVKVNDQENNKWKYNEKEKILIVEVAGKGDIKVNIEF